MSPSNSPHVLRPDHAPTTPPAAARSPSSIWRTALDHFVLLIYPTVVIGLEVVYGRPYSELIALSSTAFLAFGIFSLPAGWLADRWSRRNMMAAFYFGCGVVADRHRAGAELADAVGRRCSRSACSPRSITRSAWRC